MVCLSWCSHSPATSAVRFLRIPSPPPHLPSPLPGCWSPAITHRPAQHRPDQTPAPRLCRHRGQAAVDTPVPIQHRMVINGLLLCFLIQKPALQDQLLAESASRATRQGAQEAAVCCPERQELILAQRASEGSARSSLYTVLARCFANKKGQVSKGLFKINGSQST